MTAGVRAGPAGVRSNVARPRARFRRLTTLYGTVSLAILLAFAAASLLELGAWPRKEVAQGPFGKRAEIPPYVVPAGRSLPLQPLLDAGSAAEGRAPRSDFRLKVNGQDLGTTGAADPKQFNHWRGDLYFTLPPGASNDASSIVVMRYFVRLAPEAYRALSALAVLAPVGWIGMLYVSRNGRSRALGAMSTKALSFPLRAASYGVLAAACAYGATIVFGVWSGHALPTATVFTLAPRLRVLSTIEPLLPYTLLAAATLGAVLSWLATVKCVDARTVRREEFRLMRFWGRWGFAILLLLFVLALSGGGWSGKFRAMDQNYMSIAGLAPQSDAMGYFEGSLIQGLSGMWHSFGARRPVAQAFRDATVLASSSWYSSTLLIQAALLAGALYLAARSLARWRGLWPALGFTALAAIVLRPFVFTTLTEPLGAIVVLASVPLLVASLRFQCRPAAVLAVGGATAALWIRMGALLFIPFMVGWAALCFRNERRGFVSGLLLASAAVVAVVGVGMLLTLLYAPPGAAAGNFGFTLCGLSVGADWSECAYRRYAADVARLKTEQEVTAFMIHTALGNIFENPSVFLGSLWRNAVSYVSGVPTFYLNGYGDGGLHRYLSPAVADLVLLALVPGIAFVLVRRASWTERLLWAGLVAAAVSSAALIMADDGWRVLHVTHLLIAVLLAFGFASPASVRLRATARLQWQPAAYACAAFIVILVAAPAALHLTTRRASAEHDVSQATDGSILVGGGRKLAGFVVVADDVPRPLSVASLPWSEFVALFRATPFDPDPGPFLDRVKTKVPFAFAYGPPVRVAPSPGAVAPQSTYFILPPAVLERPDVWAWRLQLVPGASPGFKFMAIEEAASAEPIM